MKYAVLEYLKNLKDPWKIVINNHFYLKRTKMLETYKTWTNNAPVSSKKDYEKMYNDIEKLLLSLQLMKDCDD
jgi:hypothetical protein